MNVVAENIKYERLKAGLTQKSLAQKAEISCSFLCDIEKGRANPALTTLQRIAEALKVSDYNIFLKQNYVNTDKDDTA